MSCIKQFFFECQNKDEMTKVATGGRGSIQKMVETLQALDDPGQERHEPPQGTQADGQVRSVRQEEY